MSDDDRRHEMRVRVNLIIRVQSAERIGTGPWIETTITADASPDGVSVLLEHPLAVGQLVRLQLLPPIPAALGGIAVRGASAEVWGVVRGVKSEAGGHRVGLMFLDPAPAAAREVEGDSAERRREERFPIRVSFIVQHVDDLGAILQEGLTVAENISRSGAQLASAVPFTKGNVVVLQETTGAFEGRAEITHTWVDEAGLRRIHVRFLDGRSPDPVVPGRG